MKIVIDAIDDSRVADSDCTGRIAIDAATFARFFAANGGIRVDADAGRRKAERTRR